jgi:hypothetical protein
MMSVESVSSSLTIERARARKWIPLGVGATPWVDAACLHCRLDAWVSAVVSTEAMHAVGPVVVAESVERTVSLIVRGSAHLEAEGAAAQIEWMRADVALVVVDGLAIRGVAALLERRADPLLLATLSDGW